MEYEQALQIIHSSAALWNQALTPETIHARALALSSVIESPDLAQAAIQTLSVRSKFLPTVAEIVDAVADVREARWADAKARHYEPADLTTPALGTQERHALEGEVEETDAPGPGMPDALRDLIDSIGSPKPQKRRSPRGNDDYWERTYGAAAVKRAEDRA